MVSIDDKRDELEADNWLQDNFINLAKQGFEAYQANQTPRTLRSDLGTASGANRYRNTDGGSQGSHGGQQGQQQQQQGYNQGEQQQGYGQNQQGGGYGQQSGGYGQGGGGGGQGDYGEDESNYSRPPPPQQHGSNQEYYNQNSGGQQGGRLNAPSGNEVYNRPGADSESDMIHHSAHTS